MEVRHRTVYRYRRPVRFGVHRAMFRPRDSHDLRILETSMRISPGSRVRWIHDVFANSISVITLLEDADELRLESRILVKHYGLEAPVYPIAHEAETYPFAYDQDDVVDLGRSRERHHPDPDGAIEAWARRFLEPGIRTLDLLGAMTRAVPDEFAYEVRHEHGTNAPSDTLAQRRGTCRDFALFLMEAARSLGFAARFVSGYLYDPALDDGPEGAAAGREPADAGDEVRGAGATHAWAQIYLPSAGWVELDPTNGIVGGQSLIRVAVARDPRQAIPVSGTYYGAADDFLGLDVDVGVRRVPQPD